MANESSGNHVELRNFIDKHFDRKDLRSLCYELHIDFDHLPDTSKLIQVEELILVCARQNRKQDLLTKLAELRPNVAWPSDYTHPSVANIVENWAEFRRDALNHATTVIERKSRILKPEGELPKLQSLFVTFHDKNINYRFSKKGKFEPAKKPPLMLLSDVVRRDQRILLLGDLGTGKSTMVGLFIKETSTNPTALSLLVPANSLKLPSRATIQDVLNGFSRYFNDHISVRTPAIEMKDILDIPNPVYIVIDGLDEIPNRQASQLLNLVSETANHYSNLWFIAIGRPVELRGVNHQNWQIVTTVPLQTSEKLQFLQAESLANGHSPNAADQQAKQLLHKLKNIPTLDSLATTPLAIRLLHSKLLETQFDSSTTLGDLLYDLLKERMGKWSQGDLKAKAFHTFETIFPDEHSRISLFGEFASQFDFAEGLSIEQTTLNFRGLLEQKVSENVFILAKEAVDFLIQSGILTNENDQLRYAIQPLFEFLTGYGLAERWRLDKLVPDRLGTIHWRIVSFAATVIRILKSVDKLRSYLLDYLEQLLVSDRNIPAACYILAELQDTECAMAFIDLVNQMGMRPLTYFGDEKEQSTLAIATTIKLAGQKGFDWFFEHYLDPRYPIINTSSRLVDEVFEQWVHISQDQLSDYEYSKLQKLIRPHIAANTHQTLSLIPSLTVLMPEAFKPEEALWFSRRYLGSGTFSTQTKTHFVKEFNNGNEQLVNNVLLQITHKGHENAKSAAWLWLQLNSEERPHALVLKTLLSAYGRSYLDVSRDEYLELCEKRVGKTQWYQFLRWCLFHRNERFAAGAAIELYKLGEKRLSILGKPLLHAMHDGGYFKLAEETLHLIIKDLGSEAVSWLANQISATNGGLDGAHSGWWRIFLG